jgi:hypothetical protein
LSSFAPKAKKERKKKGKAHEKMTERETGTYSLFEYKKFSFFLLETRF